MHKMKENSFGLNVIVASTDRRSDGSMDRLPEQIDDEQSGRRSVKKLLVNSVQLSSNHLRAPCGDKVANKGNAQAACYYYI